MTFQNEMKMEESQNELKGIKEDFCTVSIKDEEVSSHCFILYISGCSTLCIYVCSPASHLTEFFSYLPNISSFHVSKVRKHWYYLWFFNSWMLFLGISTLTSCFSWYLMCLQFYVDTCYTKNKN